MAPSPSNATSIAQGRGRQAQADGVATDEADQTLDQRREQPDVDHESEVQHREHDQRRRAPPSSGRRSRMHRPVAEAPGHGRGQAVQHERDDHRCSRQRHEHQEHPNRREAKDGEHVHSVTRARAGPVSVRRGAAREATREGGFGSCRAVKVRQACRSRKAVSPLAVLRCRERCTYRRRGAPDVVLADQSIPDKLRTACPGGPSVPERSRGGGLWCVTGRHISHSPDPRPVVRRTVLAESNCVRTAGPHDDGGRPRRRGASVTSVSGVRTDRRATRAASAAAAPHWLRRRLLERPRRARRRTGRTRRPRLPRLRVPGRAHHRAGAAGEGARSTGRLRSPSSRTHGGRARGVPRARRDARSPTWEPRIRRRRRLRA